MDSSKCCIVNVGISGWYPQGSRRLKESLIFHGWAGDTVIFNDLPITSQTHESNPYSFKIRAIEISLLHNEIKSILWCDSSIYAVKNPMIIFDEMQTNKYGMFLFQTGYNVAQTATDSVLKYAGITRDEAELLPEYASGCVGFNLENKIAKKVWERWKKYMLDGQFKNSRKHDGQSEDPRFLFGRQDQTALSLACHEFKVRIPQSERIAYYGQNYNKEKLIFFIQGL